MLSTYYDGMPFASVKSIPDFFKDRSLLKVKQVYDAARILFKTGKAPEIMTCQTAPIQKIVIVDGTFRKIPIAEIVVIPGERRLDLYDGSTLLAQWKSKKLVYKGFSPLLDSMKFDTNFVQLYSVL